MGRLRQIASRDQIGPARKGAAVGQDLLSSRLQQAGRAQLAGALGWWDARAHDGAPFFLRNLGRLGEAGDLRLGSSSVAELRQGKGGTFLRLPGTTGNYAQTSDAAANSLLNDFTLDVRVAMDKWVPAAFSDLLTKWNTTATDLGFIFAIENTNGVIHFYGSTSGTAVALDTTSSIAPSTLVNDGDPLTLRIERRASDGRVQFFTSVDDVTFTQLGITRTTASGALFDSAQPLRLGTEAGAAANNSAGRFYRARMWSGLVSGGAATLTVDCDPRAAGAGDSSFVTATGETWAVKRPTAWIARGPGGPNVVLPAVGGNYVYTVDTPANSPTTQDIEWIARVSMASWTGATPRVMSKENGAGLTSWTFAIDSNGKIAVGLGTDGSTLTFSTSNPTNLAPGARAWLRATWVRSSGLVSYYMAADQDTVPSSWTALGSGTNSAGATLSDNAGIVNVGTNGSGNNLLNGTVHRALMNVGGAPAVDFDPASAPLGAVTWRAVTSEVWTIVQTGATGVDAATPQPVAVPDVKYVLFPKIAGNSITTPDTVGNSITGDITVEALLAPDLWAAGATQSILTKRTGQGTNNAWAFYVNSVGNMGMFYTPDGTTGVVPTSSINLFQANAVVNGQPKWLKWERRASDGRVQFHFADDVGGFPGTYTQLGTDVTTVAGATFDSTAPIELGSSEAGTANLLGGKLFRVKLYSGLVSGGAPTIVANMNPNLALDPYLSFVGALGETWTFNRPTQGRKLVVADRPLLAFGTDDYAAMMFDHPAFDPGATGKFTAIVAMRYYGDTPGHQVVFSKRQITGSTPGWELARNTNVPGGIRCDVSDGTNASGVQPSNAFKDVGPVAASMILSGRGASGITLYKGSVSLGSGTTTAVGAIDAPGPLQLGARDTPPAAFADFEFLAAVYFDRDLSFEQERAVMAALVVPV